MLNTRQLKVLNDIFHSSIKPILEQNEDNLNEFMQKGDNNMSNDTRIDKILDELIDHNKQEIYQIKKVAENKVAQIDSKIEKIEQWRQNPNLTEVDILRNIQFFI